MLCKDCADRYCYGHCEYVEDDFFCAFGVKKMDGGNDG